MFNLEALLLKKKELISLLSDDLLQFSYSHGDYSYLQMSCSCSGGCSGTCENSCEGRCTGSGGK